MGLWLVLAVWVGFGCLVDFLVGLFVCFFPPNLSNGREKLTSQADWK